MFFWFMFFWVVTGLLTAIGSGIIQWDNGEDITISDIILLTFIFIIGPFGTMVIIFDLVTDFIYFCYNKISNYIDTVDFKRVIIKGRKRVKDDPFDR